MAKPVNEKCVECSNRQGKDWRGKPKPDCYVKETCAKTRSYYANHDVRKWSMLQNHRYLRYRDDKCAVCQEENLLEVHHIIPQCKGGLDARFNLVTLCGDCHGVVSRYYKVIGWH
jgi:5-methylcytosine-specific restriction endonuclease McrA